MKNKIKLAVAILCLGTALGSAVTWHAATIKDENSDTYYVTDARERAIGEKKQMQVCSSTLNVYGSPTLSGAVVAVRTKGDIVTASTDDGLVYCIYSNSGIVGYCHARGLIYNTTKTVAKLPYVWEIVTLPDIPEIPENPENTGDNPESDATVQKEVLMYSDLTDVNEYAYSTDSPIAVSSKTVLVQRDILRAIEKKSDYIKSLGYTISVKNGYSLTDYNDEALADCPVSSKTGALMKLALVDSTGAELSPVSDGRIIAALSETGIICHAGSDWFYFTEYENYLQISVSNSDLVYTIYE